MLALFFTLLQEDCNPYSTRADSADNRSSSCKSMTRHEVAADELGAPCLRLSLACAGCARLPLEMDDEREKHPVCADCVKEELPTTYWCGIDCPARPVAWERHAAYHHKEQKKRRKRQVGDGVALQRAREIAAQALFADQTGGQYWELLAEGLRYDSKEDWRRAARAYREAIALRPDKPGAYFNLGAVLAERGHCVEAVFARLAGLCRS